MTTIFDARVPRKRVATYGKAARKRVPGYGFQKAPHDAEPHKIREEAAVLRKTLPAGESLESVKLSLESRKSPQAPSRIFELATSQDEVAPAVVKLAVLPEHLPADEKLGLAKKKARSRNLSLAFTAITDVFEVPTSDDEAVPTRLKSLKTNITTTKYQWEHQGTHESTGPVTQKMKIRKEANLNQTPLHATSTPVAVKSPPRPSAQNVTLRKVEPSQIQQINGQTSASITRLKNGQRNVKPTRQKSPQKLPRETALSTSRKAQAASSLSNTAVLEANRDAEVVLPEIQLKQNSLLDPGTVHHFDGYSNNTNVRDKVKSSKGRAVVTTMRSPKRKADELTSITKKSPAVPLRVKRRRLIDTLVEQIVDEEDVEGKALDLEGSNTTAVANVPLESNFQTDSQRKSVSLETSKPSVAVSGSQGSQPPGPRFTYSRQRSMLAEEDPMQDLDNGLSYHAVRDAQQRRTRRGSIPFLQPLPSFTEEVEENDGKAPVTTVRSVHELRQAGANKRFLDEVDDILDRIATPAGPLSTRRSGLLDLAMKMRDTNFTRHFRANGGEQRLFLHLGQETDLVSGFLMVSLLVMLLTDASMPHIVTQLRRQGIARLLIRLLECEQSIIKVGKERKTNMSGIAKSLLSDQHDFLLQLRVWEELQPQTLSSRTIALKCLEIMVRQTREAGDPSDIFSKELTTNLFAILKNVTNDTVQGLPNANEAVDFCLVLSALESHSITARTVQDESIWICDFLPIIAVTLKWALTRPVDEFDVLQLLILRLTLNVTNNNPRASDVFAKDCLIAAMGQTIVKKFNSVSHYITEEDLSMAVDHLILVLGVMINFVEWSPAARESLQTYSDELADPLDSMIQLFMDNQERAFEAASVEESAKNVAFGYLSVLLGYLCLVPAVSERIRSRQPRKTLRPLIASIEEFIGHHKAVDDLIKDADDGYSTHTGLTERLECLVAKLGESQTVRG